MTIPNGYSADAEVQALYGQLPGVKTVKATVAFTVEEMAAEEEAAYCFLKVCQSEAAIKAAKTDAERSLAIGKDISVRATAIEAFRRAGEAHTAALTAMLPPR